MRRIRKQMKCWARLATMGFLMISIPVDNIMAAPAGSGLYKKVCKKCHGKTGAGKKSRTGAGKYKYPPINQLSRLELSKIIYRYRGAWQDKTFNKAEKKMAKPAGKLSDEDIELLAEFISSQLINKH